MKTADRFLLHTLDAATPGGLHRRSVRAVIMVWAHACGYLAAFVLGLVIGGGP